MPVDLQPWAERVAPTLDHAGWRDAERDAYAGTDEAERFDTAHARALLEQLRTVAIDVLTTRQAAALGLVCDALPPVGPALAATLAELLELGLIESAPIDLTDFGYEVLRYREEYGIDDAPRQRGAGR
jgi:hypothetical protein